MSPKIEKNQKETIQEEPMFGISPQAKRLSKAARKLAKIDSNVLIIGETGTGKEFTARHIYQLSPRNKGAFVRINCSALGKTIDFKNLLGQNLEGMQTVTRSIGLLEKANNGILFLDSVSNMNLEYQDELLQAIKTKKLSKVNGNENIEVEMRVISTSNHDLTPDIESGKFKKDLYYQLNALTLVIPPLRERKQDIPELFSFFLKKHCELQGREIPPVQAEFFESILEHDWKGNIRELENTVQNLVLMSPEGVLSPDFLSYRIKRHPLDFLEPTNLKRVISEIEIYLIKKALNKFGGNQVKAAKLLGLPEPTLRFKMKKYAIPKQ